MTNGADFMRRATLAIRACLLLSTGTAFAQDPRATTVQKVARDWLVLADNLDAAATWKAAGAQFQQAITVAQWVEGMRREREPRGALVQRTAIATSFASSLAGQSEDGNYALLTFRTSFANSGSGGEDVTLQMGSDGVWRVIGYVIR